MRVRFSNPNSIHLALKTLEKRNSIRGKLHGPNRSIIWELIPEPASAQVGALGVGTTVDPTSIPKMPDADLPDLLKLAGASPQDLAWFEGLAWDPARVPEATPDDLADYECREALLNSTLTAETFAERGESPAGRLAAAIGARIADLKDRLEGEETD